MTIHAQLLAKIKARKGQGLRFGHGIWSADKYVESLAECVGPGLCNRVLTSEAGTFSRAMKEAGEKLTYTGSDLSINDRLGCKLATSEAAIKKMLGGVALPPKSLMAFTHTLTTPREDRDGDILETAGAIVDAKLPLLWQHVHTLPIGKMLTVVEHNADHLKLASVLLDMNQMTADAAILIDADVLRFSHGFRALAFEERKNHEAGVAGFRVKNFEVMEESLVSVPSNTDAAMEEVMLLSKGKLKSEFFKAHAKSMQRLLPKQFRGMTLKLGSLRDLKVATDSGLVKTWAEQGVSTVEAGAPRTESDASTDVGGAPGHDHHANDNAGEKAAAMCPKCGEPGKDQGEGTYKCENGHMWKGKEEMEAEDKGADCGCGGKCGKCGEKAVMARESYGSQAEAEARATELGCTSSHATISEGGKVTWHPCADPYSLDLYIAQPVNPPVPAPGRTDGIAVVMAKATLESISQHLGGAKVGRQLSSANLERLRVVVDDLAALNAEELPRGASAMVERSLTVLQELISAASPITDEDPQPKSAGDLYSEQEALEILCDSKSAAFIQRAIKTLNAMLAVHKADQKAASFRKFVRRK